jgi:hypothetical protein
MGEKNIEKYSAEEWDYIRRRYSSSILSETEIGKLGQNVGISWPFKGRGETPAKYTDYDFEELKTVPGFIGKVSRVKVLMDILRETLAFDSPFGDLVASLEIGSLEDATFTHSLDKLGIPEDFPATLMHFSEDTQELLKNEGVGTLIECVHFCQNIAQGIPIGGDDLKGFLNSLAQKDEWVMAKHMPYRRGERGLHLAEAIGLLCEGLDTPTQLYFMQEGGITLSDEEQEALASSSKLNIEASVKCALDKLAKVLEWFSAEAPELQQAFATGGSPERFFITINELRRERMAVELSKLYFAPKREKKSGFLGRIFGG